MEEMYDRDEVIRQAASAANNHASGVARALSAYLQAGAAGAEERALRAELVALAAGFESSSHDGSTYELRRQAAVAALGAWDGSGQGVFSEALGVRGSQLAWQALGVTVYAGNDLGSVSPDEVELILLGVAAKGRSEAALLWAVAEKRRRREVDEARAAEFAFAKSIGTLAGVMGSESARAFVQSLPEKIRHYEEAVLRNERG